MKGAGAERVGQIAVPVEDVERSIAFYEGVLGLRLLFRAGPLAFLDGGGPRIMLAEPEGAQSSDAASSPILYYTTGDLEASHARLEAEGVEVVSPPHVVHRDEHIELRIGFYRDPDGHLFGMMREVART